MQPKPNNLLLHPIFLVALFLLILNDAILKWSFHNILTGKLSDFAGMIVAPIFLYVLFPRAKSHAIFIIGILFFIWKMPFIQPMLDWVNHYTPLPINRVVDYSDLLALAFLIVPLRLIQENSKSKQLSFPTSLISKGIIMIITSFSLVATSVVVHKIPPGDLYLGKTFTVKKTKEQVIETFEHHGFNIQKDSTDIMRNGIAGKHKRYYYKINNLPLTNKSPNRNHPNFRLEYQAADFFVPRDTLAEVKFYLVPQKKSKTSISIINITFQNQEHEQKWKTMKRKTKYYKKEVKQVFLEILGKN